jgi:hypothetical protein
MHHAVENLLIHHEEHEEHEEHERKNFVLFMSSW